MSGGSYNYAYSRLDELGNWSTTLDDMAARCREWAASEQANTKYVNGKDVPTTLEDRARVHVRAMLLERAAARLRRATQEIELLVDVMHDVEWVASGDSGVDVLMVPLKEQG